MPDVHPTFGEYIVFVDESGDHGLVNIDASYPIFVLALCLFRKLDYVESICPAVQRLKFKHWGHDAVVLHEHDIRKPSGAYAFLQQASRRAEFMTDLNGLIAAAPFEVIAEVIDKAELDRWEVKTANPYTVALESCLSRLNHRLEALGESDLCTHIVVEKRGRREDAELELEFRRICDGANWFQKRLPFQIVMASKESNAAGMQLADLVARPIGIRTLRPGQSNRAYEILEPKICARADAGGSR